MPLALEDPRLIEFDVRTDEMLINMGPQHPSTHGLPATAWNALIHTRFLLSIKA